MAKMQPFMIAQLLGDMATVERRRIDLGRKGRASVDIPVDATAGWARGPQPTSATLRRNQSVEVRVLLEVPTDAQAGDDHAIVFTATRDDAGSVYNSAVVQVIVLRPDEPEALR